MRLSDLRDKEIETEAGERLGRVHEVHCDKGAVTALMCGPGSLIERLTARRDGRRIDWACVLKVTDRAVVVASEKDQQKTSGSRSRQRTPRPSARRSKR